MKQPVLKMLLLLVVAMLAASTTTAQTNDYNEYDFSVDGKYYKILSEEDRTVKFVCGEMLRKYSGDIRIPEAVSHDGITYTVTAISKMAFYMCGDLTSVVMPNTITAIIDDYDGYVGVFYECNSLKKVILSKNLAVIPSYTFYGCGSLSSIDLSNVTEIGGGAFSGCTSLTSADLPQTTEVGGSAFSGCTSLVSVDLPQATEIGERAFFGCTSLTSVDLPQTTEIDGNAFTECTSLTSVDLPQATTIGWGAFGECPSLASVDLPKATYIAPNAFSGCTSLTSVNLPQATKIDHHAFNYCTSLASVEIPQATTIGYAAFQECISLKSIKLSYGISILGENLFYDCVSLTEMDIPRSVSTIEKGCFYMCNNIKEIYLPYNVSEIGEGAFYAHGLKTVTCESPIPPTCSNSAFLGGYGTVLNVPIGSAEAYRFSVGWSNFATINEIEFTGVEDAVADNGVDVRVIDGRIVVDGVTDGGQIHVYNLSGQPVYSGTGCGEIPIDKKGVYVVKIANETFKIIL